MIDLTPLKNYTIDDAGFFIDCARKSISNTSFDEWFEKQLSLFLDCSKLSSDGRRLLQTDFYSYKVEMTTTIACIERFAENKDYYYEKLLSLHNNNLEFEAINGMVFKPISKGDIKPKTRRSRKQPTIFDDKPKKETSAELKLKAHIAKINLLNIKIKPVRNDNTV